ncbi:transporter substrate-binding domain-containing protein [Nitratireductor kimnyeongensis]|uniref:Transporter substrate-binding domain-containing protein n=1 Tax=Nitratireductor kimnyeongensis TaxID=430679 RepID=A0ABW0T6A6_9HYPH|nr:transporter substrate-binding domain-containing protein [Nitratireductor kimnyeongensis]
MKWSAFFIAIALFFFHLTQFTIAQDAAPPGFWEPKQRQSKPDLSALARLRFLTTVDFFPFNYLDAENRLSGLHIDLAREICSELEMAERCQVQALPWNELDTAIENRQGEAIIAGMAITAENRERYLFSRPYLRFPARLVTRNGEALAEPLYTTIAGKRVGVIGASAHEMLFRDLFPQAQSVVYSRADWLFDDLKSGKIDGVFGDGVKLSFWLASRESENCCTFAGGPYLAPEYLGQGLAIAVPRDMPQLAQAIDFALHNIDTGGRFTDIYLRYFPLGFY